MHDFIEVQKKKIKDLVGDDKVLLGLSGGVDSSVVAALLHEAIGDQLIAMFIDHGSAAQRRSGIRNGNVWPQHEHSIWSRSTPRTVS